MGFKSNGEQPLFCSSIDLDHGNNGFFAYLQKAVVLKWIYLLILLLSVRVQAQDQPPPEPPYPASNSMEQEALQVKQTGKPNIPDHIPLKGVRKKKHPGAKQGLKRITAKGEYIYETPESPQTKSISVHFGSFPSLATVNSQGDGFADIYGEGGQAFFLFDYEWIWGKTALGRLHFKLGTGILFASGKGRINVIRGGTTVRQEAFEEFTMVTFPNSASFVYRFEIFDKQYIVPYVEAGGDAFAIAEIRNDNKPVKLGYAPAAHGAAGVLISLTAWSREAAFIFDSNYGVNNAWLSLEMRQYVGFDENLDFTSQVVNAGFTFDY